MFILAAQRQPAETALHEVYKNGRRPAVTFYVPFHLSPIEAPNSVARAVLFGDAPVKPLCKTVADVITIAKRDLRRRGVGRHRRLPHIRHAANADTCAEQNLLPMGLGEGCVLKRDLPMDAA